MKILIEVELNEDEFKINGVLITKISRDLILGEIILTKLAESKKIKSARMLKIEEE